MISDMERIGDQAADIAEIARDMRRQAASRTWSPIGGHGPGHHQDGHRQRGLLCPQGPGVWRRQSSAYDDVVDDLFLQVREELIRRIGMGDSGRGVHLDLLMIAKYLERIGDHAVNIAEWVEYSLTGHHADLP